ncbi:MAG TPA: acyltransferase domain-containing protein, partial [Amycolatopsis sp.]|nr:acyltransferase domain-containing protein [Amycolatopsis sp.]
SVKSMIGHTMPAAGIAALVKASLAVYHGFLPPTLHCEDPHPELARTRFQPIGTARPWADRVRRAGVNAFGFGGINAHVVLESAPGAAPAAFSVREPERVLRLAANSPEQLIAALDAPDTAVSTGRYRLGIVGPTPKKRTTARKIVAKGVPWQGRHDIWFTPRPLLSDPHAGIAFVFPGLEAEFAPRVDDVAAHFGLPAPDSAAGDLGRHGTAVIGVGRLLDEALRRLAIVPDAVAGHSVGEWTALISAGVHARAEVDRLLERFDPESLRVPGVEFAVLGCGADRVRDAIATVPELVVSHENSVNQTIVCGPAEPVRALVADFRARAVICRLLPFRSGFHTPMLEPYLGPFVAAANVLDVHPPSVPVWSATTAAEFPHDAESVRSLYIQHLLRPVRFRELVENMYAAGIRAFVQTGPGQLGSLIDDTLGEVPHLTIAANSPHRSGLDQLRRVATALWVEGATPDFTALSRESTGARLDLSSGLVSLGAAAEGLLPLGAGSSKIDTLTARYPEFGLLLRETADAATAVLAALDPPPATSTLRVSTAAMPYLLDHCFAVQREGWPDETDRRPVVPATTIIRHMMDTAEKAAPGLRAVGVTGVRLNRWLVAAPAVDVEVTVVPVTGGQVEVRVGEYAAAVVLLAEQYPAAAAAWSRPPAERTPALTAERFYAERWMFHGPRYQGITALTAIGDAHVRGVLTAPTAPGGLLDNVGQLFGHWIVETQTIRRVVFPVGIGALTFFGDEPPPGTRLDCDIRIKSISDTTYEFDAQLRVGDRVWAEITGWQDQRFDSHPDTDAAYRFPERNILAKRRSGDEFLVFDRWPGLASRDLYLRKYLSAAERADYERLPAPARRHWLLGRIAIKDAVRTRLWDDGAGDIFPAEVLVRDDENDHPVVSGCHGLRLPECDVAAAHCREVAVAVVCPRSARRPWVRIEETAAQDGTVRNPPDLPERHYLVTRGTEKR